MFGIAHRDHHRLLVFRASQGQPALKISAMAGTLTPAPRKRPWSESLAPSVSDQTHLAKRYGSSIGAWQLCLHLLPQLHPPFCAGASTSWLGRGGGKGLGTRRRKGARLPGCIGVILSIPLPSDTSSDGYAQKGEGTPPFVSICRPWLLGTLPLPLQPQWKKRLPPSVR